MKVVVSSTGDNLDAQIDPRFGRCSFFIIVDTDDMSFESFNNENIALNGGAGIQSASFVVSKEVKAILTGNCGPKAMQVFSQSKIDVYTGFSGTVKHAIEQFKAGKLNPATEASVAEKAGVNENLGAGNANSQGAYQNTGAGQGMGMGMGGTGRGMGGGRGLGQGRGRGMGGGCRGGGRGGMGRN